MRNRERFPFVRMAPALALILVLSPLACASAAEVGQEKASKEAGDETVATIGGKPVTRAEFDEYMRRVNPLAFQTFYDAQKQALEAMINERIMEIEAATGGKTAEALQQEILAAVPEVTDADIEKFYNENQSRMGQQSLDAMRERIRQFLRGQAQQQALRSFLEEGRGKHAVAIHLEPPRADVQIAENDPYKGPEGAAVTIIEFSDFQ